MKCKLNDLCFVVNVGESPNFGKIVICKEYLGFLTPGVYFHSAGKYFVRESDHWWCIEGNVMDSTGSYNGSVMCPEKYLLPIKWEPIEDSEISSKELEFN